MRRNKIMNARHPAGHAMDGLAYVDMIDSETDFEIVNSFTRGGYHPQHYRARDYQSGTIKYLVVSSPKAAGFLYRRMDAFGFTTLPSGDWDLAQLVHRKEDEKLVIVSTERMPNDRFDKWCETTVDIGDLGEWLPANRSEELQLHRMLCSFVFAGIGTEVEGPPRVLATYDDWWRESSITAYETEVHSWVQGLGITLPFLGHLTENNGSRTIGYILQPITVRLAEPDHADGCRAALGKLHAAGIALGTVERWQFLVREDGEGVLLRGFFLSYRTQDVNVFENEIACVDVVLREEEVCLLDDMPRPPPMAEATQLKLSEVEGRDGEIHPVVAWEAQNEGTVTVTEAEHRALLTMYARRGAKWMREDMAEALQQRDRNGGRWVPLVIGEHRTEEE
jgi:hypothetical protein